jgi:hypothetical protein
MATYATTADLETKWQQAMSAAQLAAAQVLLDEGEAILRAHIPTLDAAVAAGTVQAVLVRKVLTDAVLRVMRNPTGVTSQTVGPESATFSGLAQRAELAFLAGELALITPAVEGLSANGYAIGSFRLGRPNWCSPLPPAMDVERWC